MLDDPLEMTPDRLTSGAGRDVRLGSLLRDDGSCYERPDAR